MRQELEFKIDGIEWGKLQDEAFNKLNKNAKIVGFYLQHIFYLIIESFSTILIPIY